MDMARGKASIQPLSAQDAGSHVLSAFVLFLAFPGGTDISEEWNSSFARPLSAPADSQQSPKTGHQLSPENRPRRISSGTLTWRTKTEMFSAESQGLNGIKRRTEAVAVSTATTSLVRIKTGLEFRTTDALEPPRAFVF